MTLSVCIKGLITEGRIKAGQGEEAERLYQKHYNALKSSMPMMAATAEASERAIKTLERNALIKRRDALLQIQAQARWLDRMRADAGDGAINPKLAHDQMVSLDKKVDAVRGRLFSTLDGFLQRHRRNVLGEVRHKAELEDIGRALFGEPVDDLNVRETADALKETMETARTLRNSVGGHIGFLEGWGLPQHHDPRAVAAVDFETWRAHPSIDRVKVRDPETGEVALGDAREEMLAQIYQSIRTDGAAHRNPGASFMGSMAKRRADPRVLHFDGFDDWMAYQRDYGGAANIYDIITGHLSQMAREIAMMEEMGPNPAATIRFQSDWLKKSADLAGTQAERDKVVGQQLRLQGMFDELTGAANTPGNRSLALTFSAIRATQVAAKMGSAILSAVPDFATMIHTARFNQVPVMQTLGRYVSLWNPLNTAERAHAVRLGLVTDDWINLSSSAHRYTGEELTGEVTRRMADFVLRTQGLARHTRNGQWAFGMEFLAHLTDMRSRAFDNLDPALQQAMQRHDIGGALWDAYRATPTVMERGAEWIMPMQAERKAGDAILKMVLAETDYAMIMPDLRTRSYSARPGTGMGEFWRSALLFKSFPIAMINLHGRRMFEQAGAYNRATYGLTLLGMMMAGGALSSQLKMLANGKDPQPMNTPEFMGKALIQSGGLGLFGDLLYNSENSFGGDFVRTLAGPLLGQTVPDLAGATIGNAKKALDGNPDTETTFGKDLAKFGLSEVPGNNLWYTRIAYQRLFADMVRRWSDPDADAAFARQIDRAENEGTQFWAAPGQGLADMRMPDFSNAWTDEEDAMMPN